MATGGISRRRLLRDAALATGAAAAGSALRAAPSGARRRPPRPRVAVLGGGVAGLTAAHELIERGFSVDVYESKALGGRARSFGVPGSARGGRMPLPGEHGFRAFFGFYHHVPDTMRRIPFGDNANGVWDNLVAATDQRSPRTGGRPDATFFGVFPHPLEATTPDGMQRLLMEGIGRHHIPFDEGAYFANRMQVFLSSSDERRYGQWENVSWWDFVGAASRSEEYQKVLARGVTRTIVAAEEMRASARTIGNLAEAFIYTEMQRGNDGPPDRVLNAPTNDAWIDPWVRLLRARGVRFHLGHTVEGLDVRKGRVRTARARDRRGRRRWIEADWFVCALPVEGARRLWSRAVLALDPALERMDELHTSWMNGLQFFLREPLDIVHGHMTFVDAPWALTALTQAQFWPGRRFTRDYGDGEVVDCLSTVVSDWKTPGLVYGKPARSCRPKQIAREVLTQIQEHVNDNGAPVLTDDMVHSWSLDPAIAWSRARGRNTNAEPLMINTVGSWEQRPEARTRIPNLFLAGEYVRTDMDVACMESANESARFAVNGLLEEAASRAPRAATYRLYDPPEFEAEKRVDAERYRTGQPNLHDRP